MASSRSSRKSLAAYMIGVFLVWGMIFAVAYIGHGPTPDYPLLHVFGGFVLGMISMYIGIRLHPPRKSGGSD